MKRIIYFLGITLIACSSATTESANVEQVFEENIGESILTIANSENVVDNDFDSFYQNFSKTIVAKKTTDFNNFIHQDYGVYFIEAPGAMPMFTKFYSIEKFKDVNNNKFFFDLPFLGIDKMPINDTLPKIICGGEVYDKYGCFAQQTNPLNESQIWNYTDLNDKQKQEIEVIAKTITYTVVNTANYTFYFSLIGNSWYVTFIDIRIPCSA